MSESGIARTLLFFPKQGARAPEDGGVRAASELVRRVREGDQDAFDELYRRYSPMVHGIVLSRARRSEVDDIVQDVFVAVFRKLDSLNDHDALGAWIASIARRRVADDHRSARLLEEIPEDAGAEPVPVNEANEALAAIRSLPDAYSETLTLRLVEGMTGPEIAEVTGLTHDSVRVNLHRGMKMLREKLGIER